MKHTEFSWLQPGDVKWGRLRKYSHNATKQLQMIFNNEI